VAVGRARAVVRAFLACVCLGVVLAACSGTGVTGAATTPRDAAPGAAAPGPAAAGAAPTVPAAPELPSPAIATADIPISFIDGGVLQVEVTGIDVVGELMRLRLTFTAKVRSSTQVVAVASVLAGDETSPAMAISPELIDPIHLKAYEAVVSVPNGTAINLTGGGSRTLDFYYAAPQDDIRTVDIVLSSQAPTMTDVPVTA
jgi:hypothetical protein